MARGGAISLDSLSGVAWSIGLAIVFIALFIYAIVKIKTTLGSNDSTVNSTLDAGVTNLSSIVSWIPVLVAVLMTALAVSYFMLMRNRA